MVKDTYYYSKMYIYIINYIIKIYNNTLLHTCYI